MHSLLSVEKHVWRAIRIFKRIYAQKEKINKVKNIKEKGENIKEKGENKKIKKQKH